MKKSKIGAFAVLGSLPLAALTIGVIAGAGTGRFEDILASEGVPCTLRLDASNTPTLTGGAGTDVISHVEFKYNKVDTKAGNHIAIKDGGYIQNSGKVYDPVTKVGGRINGIKAITVVYEDHLTDVYTQTANVEVKVGFTGYEDKIAIKSGERYDFTNQTDNLPRNFKIGFSYFEEPMYTYAPRRAISETAPYLAVKSIVIEATMHVEHSIDVNLTPYNYKDVEFFVDDTNSTIDNPLKAKTAKDVEGLQLENGQVVKVKVKEGAAMAFDETTLNITNSKGEKVEVTKTAPAEGEKMPTYSFTVTDDLTVNVDASIDLRPYKDAAFLGEHTMTAPDGTTAVLNLLDTGEYTLAGKSGTYTYDDATRKFTLSAHSELDLKVVTFYDSLSTTDGALMYIKDGKPFLANQDAAATTMGFAGHAKSGYIDVYEWIDDNGNIVKLFKHYNDIDVLDGRDTVLTEIVADQEYEIFAKEVNGDNILFGNSGAATNPDGSMVQRIRKSGTRFNTVANDGLRGTYAGAQELVLDGFGGATLGGTKTTYTHSKKRGTVTIDGVEYDIDATAHTYQEHYDMPDPWLVGTTRYKLGGKTLAFANGKVTISGIEGIDATVPYQIFGEKVMFSAHYSVDYFGMGMYEPITVSGTADFLFTIVGGGTSLVSDTTIAKDAEDWTTKYGTVTIVTKGDTYALEEEKLAITQTVSQTRFKANVVNNGTTAYNNVVSIRFQGSNEDKALTLENVKVGGVAATATEVKAGERFLGYDVVVNVAPGAQVDVEADVVATAERTFKFKTLGYYRSTSSTQEVVIAKDKLAITQDLKDTDSTFTIVNNGTTSFEGIVAIRFQGTNEDKALKFVDFRLDGISHDEVVSERIVNGRFLGYDVRVNIAVGQTLVIKAHVICDVTRDFTVKTTTPNSSSTTGTLSAVKAAPTNLDITQFIDANAKGDYDVSVVNNSSTEEFTGTLSIRFKGGNEKKVLTLTDFSDINGELTATEVFADDGRFLGYDVTITVAAGDTAIIHATYAGTVAGTYRLQALAGTNNSASGYITIA